MDNKKVIKSDNEKADNLPSCNSCSHKGTWDCIKCKGFDRYENGWWKMTNYNELRDGQEFYANGYKKGYEDAKKEYARPQGKWIHRRVIAKDRSFDMVVCSNCQTEFSWDAETGVAMDNYETCPNCGAKMQ